MVQNFLLKGSAGLLAHNLKTGLHKGFAFISFENSDFYENIKKFEGRHIIDDEEVICSLTSEEKSLLSHGASTMQLNRRINENSYGIDISKTNSDNEVFEFIRNEENGKEKKIKFSTPKLICRNSIDFQVHKKGAKEANLLHKLRKVSDSGEESGRGSGLSDSASSKKNSRVTTTTKRDQKYLNDGSSFSEGLNNCSYQSIK
uniref:RRM domain-containing protein n=1 Tax=Setaria digitata TaxID=48799 RepID=A0A915PIT0_9BILA